MQKITHKTANKIAKSVLTLLHRVDPRTINIEDQINGHLKDIGLGWVLKDGTYIDGVSIQSIKQLSQDIRLNAIERF